VITRAPTPRPDWKLWKQIPTLKAWEAVALSLDIDPKAVKRVDLMAATAAMALHGGRIGLMAKQQLLTWSGPLSRFDESQEFNDRLEVTVRNVERLPSVGDAPEDGADRVVRLSEFAALARFLDWIGPDELSELGKAAEARDQTLANIQQTYNRLLTETGKPPSQRAVAKKSGHSRDAVSVRWPAVVKNRPK
jgi:hypothetical protein